MSNEAVVEVQVPPPNPAPRARRAAAPRKRRMSAKRRAHLSELATKRWAAKRAATAAAAAPAQTVSTLVEQESASVDFKLGFIKGITFVLSALEE